MPLTNLFARVLHKRDTLENWSAANPLLLDGEIVTVVLAPKLTKFKAGNGSDYFNDLPFVGDLTGLFSILSATPATNPGSPQGNTIYETTTPGTYSYFPDSTNTPIVVNAGEYVHIIDDGAYFTKVVLPVSVTGLAPIVDIDAIFDLYYAKKPTLGAAHPLVDKTTRTGSGFYASSAPIAGDWYVDMEQSFPLSRLNAVFVRNGGAASPPAAAIATDCQIVTVDASGNITFLALGSINSGVVGFTTPTYLNGLALTASNPAVDGDAKCYIAVRDTSGNAGLTFDTTGGAAGHEVWGFHPVGGGFGLRAKYANTDISYEVQLYDESNLSKMLHLDQSVSPVLNPHTPNASYFADDTWGILLYDTTGFSVNGLVMLPRFLRKGKRVVIKYVLGSQKIDVKPDGGAKLDNSTSTITLSSIGDKLEVVYDGEGGWWSL